MILYVLAAAGAEGKRPDLGKAVALFLAANGITASIRLFALVLTAESLGALNQADRVYVAIGGIAALWLSMETIVRIFTEVAPPEDPPEERGGE